MKRGGELTKYPLSWPQGWPRTSPQNRRAAKFSKGEIRYSADRANHWHHKRDLTVADGLSRVLEALRIFGVQEGDAIISTNLATRLDGLPRSDQKAPADPGAAVYWERPGEKGTKVMAIDHYTTVQDNLAAIAATLEAMRAIERHGGAQILDRAFTGFAALPAPGQTSRRQWRDVLGVPDDDQRLTKVEEQYRRLRSQYHPDKPGGDVGKFLQIQDAWNDANVELGNPA